MNISAPPLKVFNSPTYNSRSYYLKIAISPDDRFLIAGSSDSHAYIWETHGKANSNLIPSNSALSPFKDDNNRKVKLAEDGIGGNRPWKVVGHRAEVTSVAWSSDFKQVRVRISE